MKPLRRFAVHLSALVFVVAWTLPSLGVLVTSLRDRDQVAVSGWWTALSSSSRMQVYRVPEDKGEPVDGRYIVTGSLPGNGEVLIAWGVSSLQPTYFAAGETANLTGGGTLRVEADGSFFLSGTESFARTHRQRIFYSVTAGPRLTMENYANVLFAAGVGRSFLNSAIVAVPATVIPALIAAFAAYALAWMRFPGRWLLRLIVVGLLVVPLQMSLIPLLAFYNSAGHAMGFDPKSYIGVWAAHTGFGMPLAIHLLQNRMAGVPREIVESARMDGAGDFHIFTRIVLPLTFPALVSFGIFQFMWVWNDLLVALVFLGPQDDTLVLTGRLINLMGTNGGDWAMLSASACVASAVPILVFLALQKRVESGLLGIALK
ncbi:carbohydrate ABC transporter permease [Defluviimonas sp. WL0002]|uniref:Carbohydrate ABC transporter permease n=1 Tax=Albidovulum marisflavi TaxID=2984159 RepID=A0ABT2ZG27_9RHOB|nr:carbohydrate ABC transporter permease [Defluviimonas sp. WL0002]MCV2870092.1 carbohydrate ABC transporter permease [Defluviimonas sp. WL0002]